LRPRVTDAPRQAGRITAPAMTEDPRTGDPPPLERVPFRRESRSANTNRVNGAAPSAEVPNPLIMTCPLSVLPPVALIAHNLAQCAVSFL
jgi:hypothetical protein